MKSVHIRQIQKEDELLSYEFILIRKMDIAYTFHGGKERARDSRQGQECLQAPKRRSDRD